MKIFRSAILLTAVTAFFVFPAFAQESDIKIVDEVVAQVNDSVVTLSRINREVESIVEASVAEGKPRETAKAEIEAKRADLIANIINEELLIQKAKEYDFDSTIEAQVNQNFVGKMKELNLKSLDELFAEMRRQGVDPDEIRALYRKQITRDLILQQEVDRAVFNRWKAREVKAYFDANKTKFTKPEMVEVSEIFLSFERRNPESVKERAKQLVAEIRGGADFGTVAADNSDRPEAKETKGRIENELSVKDLDPLFATALKDLKPGQISDPIVVENAGVEILKLEKRTAASSEPVFDEEDVRRAMTIEVLPEERKKYLIKLRKDSYIKINDRYRAEVAPVLYAEERKADVGKNPGK